MNPCACLSTDPHECWSRRYPVPLSAVLEDNGPCECDCHEAHDDEPDDGWADVFGAAIERAFAVMAWEASRRLLGRSSRAKQRRARRRRDIQLARKARRRGVCPCEDQRIDDPGPHLATCRWANEEEGECPF